GAGDARVIVERLGYQAALVPAGAVETYGLTALCDAVADNPDAVTRFVVVGRPGRVPPRTGADKTTLQVSLPEERAGALLELLDQFATRGINLTRIESRPSGDLGRYSFSIDAEGHLDDARMSEALVGLHRFSPSVRFLGSYPRADFVEPHIPENTTDQAYLEAKAWLAALRAGQAV
ncbi:MAG: ACT domain-containing protein, partial [Micrococcales bacterium]|nr:ACT domain-containing protein [Micrococcales bacterium]